MTAGARCMLMRGGTSRGAYFLAEDVPTDPAERDEFLLRVMGTPDPRQIDGLGGATTVTSKVAIVSPSARDDVDVDYHFFQVGVAEPTISDRQNCGNILAGVGPFAVERGLVSAGAERTEVRIRMVNTGGLVTAEFATPGGQVDYDGDTVLAGVPQSAAPITLRFADLEGSVTGALLPTGQLRDEIDGLTVTLIDNGMPAVIVAAGELGLTGHESHAELAADEALLNRIDSLRIKAGELMGMGDVTALSVPKTAIVAPPAGDGMISVRSFIPRQPHQAIGVFGAISVVTGVLLDGAVGHELAAAMPSGGGLIAVEHPSGVLQVEVRVDSSGDSPRVLSGGAVSTARKIFDGTVFPGPGQRLP
ncbi:4-oxalomesaconate tautomerase [Enemella evansiae]|uniref:4-oxalomesaconate tautomerase n=1 Tax=Enemella evansiae TaxID=2016499 RepID=UPI000B96C94C|nr:4-oxalomesaconate tautomerase [Enemella evansiae]OYO03486.1 FldA protein [Enemella evansiae]